MDLSLEVSWMSWGEFFVKLLMSLGTALENFRVAMMENTLLPSLLTIDRAIQVFCCHNVFEKKVVATLITTSKQFRLEHKDHKFNGKTYDQHTQTVFHLTSGCVAWECIFPEGIDMEALSPRDVNANLRVKQAATKSKAPAAKLSQKEKDHPQPPPENVQEPPSSDKPKGTTYKTGRLLGKGGFAICYEGEQAETKQRYALKIVKSHMPQKKMEQKVSCIDRRIESW